MLVAPDIIQAKIPLPFPLKFVNCYLVRGPDGWALIDTGINWPEAREAWQTILADADLRPTDIGTIYVTHYHPDHIGLAGWWQQISGAPVYMTPREGQVARIAWNDGVQTGQEIAELFGRYGMPAAVAATVAERAHATQRMTQPLPEISLLDQVQAGANAGQTLLVAGRPFQPLALPGHADEQLCLYEAATRTLLIADQVLPRISPNISILPNTLPDPLGRYLASFDTLAALDVARVLPGHGRPFSDLNGRLQEMRVHHAARINDAAAAIGAGATGYEVCTRIFPLDALSPHQLQFAMGETLAHVEYLVLQGRAERIEAAPISYRMIAATAA
jgi:glyoxylase-like metal-dependent hydrolase (beta-lactamase superfamily II)